MEVETEPRIRAAVLWLPPTIPQSQKQETLWQELRSDAPLGEKCGGRIDGQRRNAEDLWENLIPSCFVKIGAEGSVLLRWNIRVRAWIFFFHFFKSQTHDEYKMKTVILIYVLWFRASDIKKYYIQSIRSQVRQLLWKFSVQWGQFFSGLFLKRQDSKHSFLTWGQFCLQTWFWEKIQVKGQKQSSEEWKMRVCVSVQCSQCSETSRDVITGPL